MPCVCHAAAASLTAHFSLLTLHVQRRRSVERINATLVAIDDADPAVVMASLTRCRGAAFSHGTFAWWIAYLTAGPVVFDAGMLDYARHGQCYSAKLGVSSDPCGPTSPRGYVASHLPPWWQPVGVGEEERLTEVPCRAELRGYAGA